MHYKELFKMLINQDKVKGTHSAEIVGEEYNYNID